jgi:ribosomal protein S18 acetylase RimI-like enzyme
LIIETATLDDINALCDLLAVLFSQEAEFKPDHQAQKTGLQAIISNPDIGIILLARHNDKVVAMVSLLFSISTALGGRVAILEDMVVLPEQRGLGIGSALLNEAISTARDSGCQRITLLTDSDNTIARGFYEKQGFVRSSMLAFRILLT